MATTDEYTAESIEVLRGLEPVRRRPGMYVGDTGRDAIHHLLWEVLGNALDEHLRGFAKTIRIAIDGHRITVEDDGRGIPVDAVELVLTRLHAGTARPPHVHLAPSLLGLGVAVANALASELELTVWRDGATHVQRFAKGEPLGPIARRGRTTRTGTRIAFVPDFTILERHAWDVAWLARRCRELAALLPHLAIELDDEVFHYDDMVDALAEGRTPMIEPLRVRTTHDGITIDAAIGWHAGASSIQTFVNYAPGDGVHVPAMRDAIHAVLARRFPKRISRKRVERGLLAILNVVLADPRFGNPTRDWLSNPEVGTAVRTVIERELAAHFDRVPALLDSILLALEVR